MASKLDYLLSGPLSYGESLPHTTAFHVSTIPSPMEEFQNPWNVPSTNIMKKPVEPYHQTVIDNFKTNNISHSSNGAYCAKFPWKSDHQPLPSNYTVCERRARSLARCLGQSPSLLKMYGDIIAEQEKKGFIEQVPPTDSPGKIAYIPHHPVQKDSTTTPTRIVYDCSCRSSPDYPNLNDCLISGPPLLNDMCSILLCFQIHPFAFSTAVHTCMSTF